MIKISLCLIVKSSDEEALLLDRCLGYISNVVDEICVTITGKNKNVEQVCKKFKCKVSYYKWDNDFASARNYNFSKATGEYIMWLDADDCVRNADRIPEMVEAMKAKGVDCGIMDYLYHFDEDKNCDVTHRKIRLLKNDGCVKWFGVLHEDLLSQREIVSYYIPEVQVLHLTTDDRLKDSAKRNLEIALDAYKKYKDKKDPVFTWNVANAYAQVSEHQKAIDFYKIFIEESGSLDEIALAHCRMSDCYKSLKNKKEALVEAEKVIELKPWFPDGYLLMGNLFFEMGQYKHVKEMLVTGLGKEIPRDEAIAWNPKDYDYYPLMLLYQTYLEMGKPEDAKKCLTACLNIYPNDKKVKSHLEIIDKEIDKLKKVDAICEKATKINDKKELKKLLDQVPEELQSHPKIALIRNIHFIKENSTGKDVAIFCYSTLEDFNPELIMKRGSGGSEEAVYQMSKQLKRLGCNVTVYASCGTKDKEYDGVMWKPWYEFNARDNWDVVVSWRHPMLAQFDELRTDNLYIWLHDVLPNEEFTKQRLKKIKKIFALSQYQRDLYPEIPDDKFIISGNGIDSEVFKKKRGTIERNNHRLIYSSSYDRGLLTLLKLFPRVKLTVPEAELHIFYGWNVWDSYYRNDPIKLKEKLEIEELMKQPGVVHHGRISQEQIIDEYFKSSILAYPTEFTEISYISGMKAQAAGCIPVTTGIYAIDETIQFGLKVDSKNIYTDKSAQDEWVNGVIGLLKNSPTEKERTKMMDWAVNKFNWATIAKSWIKEWKL